MLNAFDKQSAKGTIPYWREVLISSYSDKKFLTRQVAPSSGHLWESSTKQTVLVPQVVPDSDFTICGSPMLLASALFAGVQHEVSICTMLSSFTNLIQHLKKATGATN